MQEEIKDLMALYNQLRDKQYAVYTNYARRFGLTTNEVFVLYLLWFAPNGRTQKDISETISVGKQTINAIVSRFYGNGYISYAEAEEDKRNKRIVLTEQGREYAKKIIPPIADAEDRAMNDLSIENARKLLELSVLFTVNMESYVNEIKVK